MGQDGGKIKKLSIADQFESKFELIIKTVQLFLHLGFFRLDMSFPGIASVSIISGIKQSKL